MGGCRWVGIARIYCGGITTGELQRGLSQNESGAAHNYGRWVAQALSKKLLGVNKADLMVITTAFGLALLL